LVTEALREQFKALLVETAARTGRTPRSHGGESKPSRG
jgi:hypothetical protein